ncbi:MAG: FecR family protein, partial [Opitutaceae bacterium]
NDGSVITMNANSDVRVRLTAAERRVTLSAGEARFDVAHDGARPFTVTAGGVSVRAIGTVFNVRVSAAVVDVIVVEGRVEVARDAAPAAAKAPGERPQLGAGERVWAPRLDPAAPLKIEKLDTSVLHAALTWQSRVTSFSDVPLRDMAAQFNRHNALQLVLADPELGARKIGGTFALDQVEAFVRLLEQDGDFVSDRRSEKEIVLRRAP